MIYMCQIQKKTKNCLTSPILTKILVYLFTILHHNLQINRRTMNVDLKYRISFFLIALQQELFPFLHAEENLLLTPVLELLIRILEFVQIERFIPSTQGFVGRPPQDRIALARAFVAKAVLNLQTTEALIDRLRIDRSLRRICGFDPFKRIPDASRFSRAFAEFTEMNLPARVHEALIQSQLGTQIIGHVAYDSTEIEAREKPTTKTDSTSKNDTTPRLIINAHKQTTIEFKMEEAPAKKTLSELHTETKQSTAFIEIDKTPSKTNIYIDQDDEAQKFTIDVNKQNTISIKLEGVPVRKSVSELYDEAKHAGRASEPNKEQAIGVEEKAVSEPHTHSAISSELASEPKQENKRKRGRPRKNEKVTPEEPTVIEKQVNQSVEESIRELPTVCDVGTKKNSKGFKESWIGYKLHLGVADGDIPVVAILTSASTHDSQVAIPMIRTTDQRITYLYDLADAAYCSGIIRDVSRQAGHVPLIDHNPRRGEKIEFDPPEAERYKNRTQVERVNGQLKDYHGGRQIWVRGAAKVYTHLMFGILVIAAKQLLQLG